MQIHFIFRHKNPVTGKYEEKHAKAVETDMGFFDDKKTHIFRLSKFTVSVVPIVVDNVSPNLLYILILLLLLVMLVVKYFIKGMHAFLLQL